MALECRERWMQHARDPGSIEHLFAIDSDDFPSQYSLRSFAPVILDEAGGGCVLAWNAAATRARADVLLQLSDDWIPPDRWDQQILEAIGDACNPSVLRVSDGHRTDDLLCIAILTRARLQQQGFLFAPEYQGVYSDDEFSFRAAKDAVIVNASEIRFTHAHPHYDTSIQMDETYQIQNSDQRKRSGLVTFARRNPDAFGRWIHFGTDHRRYTANAELSDVQSQLVAMICEAVRLLGDQDKLTMSVSRLTEENLSLSQAIDGWNRRSWLARALHKIRVAKKDPSDSSQCAT